MGHQFINASRHHMAWVRSIVFVTCLIEFLFFVAGCTSDIAGPEGVDEPYSMYGILNPRLEMQSLLVSPIVDRLYPHDRTIDAVVRSTDLATGDTRVWRDSVVTNATGEFDHIFWAPFRPDFGSRHRIEVVRSDGRSSYVELRIPDLVSIDQVDSGTRHFDIVVHGDSVQIANVIVVYGVRGFYIVDGPDDLGPYSSYAVSTTEDVLPSDDGWRIRVNLESDYESLRSQYYLEHGWAFDNPVCGGLGLMELGIEMDVGSHDWAPPGDGFDPHVLSNPRTLRNVQNGFGFVGGGYNQEAVLHPSESTIDDTFFFDFIDGREPEIGGCGLPGV